MKLFNEVKYVLNLYNRLSTYPSPKDVLYEIHTHLKNKKTKTITKNVIVKNLKLEVNDEYITKILNSLVSNNSLELVSDEVYRYNGDSINELYV